MNISKHSFVTPEEILSDVLKLADDEGFKDNSKGYYMSLIQQALQELAFDTFFDERTESFNVPQNLRLDMPKGAFNIKQIYLFNGTECNIANSKNVYWKRNFYTKGNGSLSKDKWNNDDPFYDNRSTPNSNGLLNDPSYRRAGVGSSLSELYYYNIQAGEIMFSSNVRNFEKVALVFNGTGVNIGEIPFVPMLFREAVKSWILNPVYQIKMAKAEGAQFNKWQTLFSMNNAALNKPFDGLWAEAQYRAKSIDSKQREDIKEYICRFNY